jgi:hypothetical protein
MMRQIPILLAFLSVVAFSADAAVSDCSEDMKAKVLAAATDKVKSIVLDCNLNLTSADVVTKQLVFNGDKSSGVTLDCNGATLKATPDTDAGTRLVVTSSPPAKNSSDQKWTAPEKINIKRCVIDGAVRVRGMAVNGEDKNLTESSRREGHTSRVQESAPREIVFSENKFIGHGTIPIYFAPGVHHSMILNSQIEGVSNSVALYLDAESSDNTIKGNTISTATTTKDKPKEKPKSKKNKLYSIILESQGVKNTPTFTGRELIAVDGSARNKIINNNFSSLSNGGIFFYRNCGEGGNIRHQTPTENEIVNNVFYYDKFDGRTPAIWLSSRNGKKRTYCDLDSGYPFGSSVSDLDYASNNLIAQNQFYKFEPSAIIRDDSEGNYMESNEKITQPITRKAGCFQKNSKSAKLLADGTKTQSTTDQGLSTCAIQENSCSDGLLRTQALPCTASN